MGKEKQTNKGHLLSERHKRTNTPPWTYGESVLDPGGHNRFSLLNSVANKMLHHLNSKHAP